MPISGVLTSLYGGHAIEVFGLFAIPAPKKNETLAEIGHVLHGLGGCPCHGAGPVARPADASRLLCRVTRHLFDGPVGVTDLPALAPALRLRDRFTMAIVSDGEEIIRAAFVPRNVCPRMLLQGCGKSRKLGLAVSDGWKTVELKGGIRPWQLGKLTEDGSAEG
jgi:hypothetical protein